jgi:hypothetical protein
MKFTVLLLTLTVGTIFAQQTPVTATSTFYDVDGSSQRAFVDFSKKSTKKLVEAVMKEEPAIRSTSLSVRLWGGNPAPAGQYRMVIIRDGFSIQNTDRLASLSQKATGMSYDDYMKKATSLRKVTGSTLRQRLASTSGDKPVNLAIELAIITTWSGTIGCLCTRRGSKMERSRAGACGPSARPQAANAWPTPSLPPFTRTWNPP